MTVLNFMHNSANDVFKFQMTFLQMQKLRLVCMHQSKPKHFPRKTRNQKVWEWPPALVDFANSAFK